MIERNSSALIQQLIRMALNWWAGNVARNFLNKVLFRYAGISSGLIRYSSWMWPDATWLIHITGDKLQAISGPTATRESRIGQGNMPMSWGGIPGKMVGRPGGRAAIWWVPASEPLVAAARRRWGQHRRPHRSPWLGNRSTPNGSNN